MRALLAILPPLLLLPLAAAAHPHVWIDATMSYVVEDGKVTGFDVTWLFDDLYSSLVQEDFDGDGDGVLSQQELDALVGISAVNLSQFSFFTRVKIDGEKHYVARVQEFYAEVTDEQRVLYRFRVPLLQAVDPRSQLLQVSILDETYYVDIYLPQEDITLPPELGCVAALQKDLNEPLYYGSYFPTYVVLDCSQS